MKNKTGDFLFSEDMVRLLQKASYIAATLKDTTIRSAYIIWAILGEDNDFSEFVAYEFGVTLFLEDLGNDILYNPDYLKSIFGEEVSSNLLSCIQSDFSISYLEELIEQTKNSFPDVKDDESTDSEDRLKLRFFDMTLSQLAPSFKLSENVELAIIDTQCRCGSGNNHVIDVMNFIYSLINIEDSSCNTALVLLGIEDIDEFKSSIEKNFKIYSNSTSGTLSLPMSVAGFCEVLTEKYTEETECDILGRDDEIRKFWITASRRTKKNSVLIGPPGCGKTAIVEAIAMQIANKKCPKTFRGYTVIELNIAALVAGTSYRGAFEERVTSLIEILKNNPKLILFIDEIHHVLGAGSTEGANMDLAGMLKPILARDDAIVIGATTENEYDKYLSRDPAFKRRFDVIHVKEPKIIELKPMIKARVENLSKYHKVSITEEVLDYIIIQAHAFNNETANPDKTISLCDSSMAVAKVKHKHVLTKRDVDAVNIEKIRLFKSHPLSSRKIVAYHESAHYVFSRVLRQMKYRIPISLSIVATDDYAGAYSFECDDTVHVIGDKNFYKEKMMSLLAGRAAEEYFFKSINNGARSDLEVVMNTAKHMILSSGMDMNELFNMSVVGEESDTYDLLTDDYKGVILTKIKEVIDSAYKDTVKLVIKYQDLIKCIGDELAQKGMMSFNELDEIMKAHGIKVTKTIKLEPCNISSENN